MERLSVKPSPPACDCYLAQHSAEASWTTAAPVEDVKIALRRAVGSSAQDDGMALLRAPTPFEEREFYGAALAAFLSSPSPSTPASAAAATPSEKGVENGDPRADVGAIRVSPNAGFRDFVAFYVSPVAGHDDPLEGRGSKVVARGRSLDYHVWTVCPCCQGIGWCRYVACFFCCCGVCPTKDWGQNMQTLEGVIAVADVGLQRVKSPSDALNNNPQKYVPPDAVEASRE